MNERLSLLNGALVVSAGVNSFDAPVHVNATLKPGVKVVVLLSGRMQIRIGSDTANEICGPASFVIRSTDETSRDQVYSPGIPVRYALIQMDEGICGEELASMLDGTRGALEDTHKTSGLGRYGENEVNYTTSERYLIAPSFTWRPDADTTLTVRASYDHDHDPSSFQPNWLPALGTLQKNPNGQIPRNFFAGHPDYNTYDREQSTIGYEFEKRLNETWTVRQNFRYMHLDSDFKAVSVSAGGPSPLGYVPAGRCGGIANLCTTFSITAISLPHSGKSSAPSCSSET